MQQSQGTTLALLNMLADLINETKVFRKQYKCLVRVPTDAVLYENGLEQNMVKCYTDGSKLNRKAGASFYIEYPNGTWTD